ncbi:hypothetical protein RUE5091_02605 [Ruegeria denitrificans]|uniref:Uncharacterized protein n=1 Tax=Ruegeria denitrificans TaxID=1715692 RepID=A0A0P1IC20_9RHOB|nr:hypothetical protein RUE5091_02605 [Ruegeria denitrificans]
MKLDQSEYCACRIFSWQVVKNDVAATYRARDYPCWIRRIHKHACNLSAD